ncbi:DUF1641 domain-containing protein [Alicyclobacillus macrosporangiidus]|uniref:Uncharacterized conserved protein YjgD, DUF1641 family n=1 Tax=Alicyclobacillus macrosporangiidus TaxID=392015 RepID=A0A1I7HVV7_9BACL|nr:DUF1641 domain-containing protein [Alicyclobacillus macrosporangiidus]SFU64797.1 Uncharacterized conserved protein YjgD, DUF1641 family [Alicyclobacillus macrosporangiidus]
MAKPIPVLHVPAPSREDTEKAALDALRDSVAQDAEALQQALRVVRGLHERGLLELTAAALEKGDDLLRLVVEQVNQPGALRLLRNAITLLQQAGAWDLEKWGPILEGAAAGIQEAQAHPPKRPLGVFGLLHLLSDPDVSRALHTLFGALKGMGRVLGQSAGEEG